MATNSDLLSDLIRAGTSREMNRSVSISMTSVDVELDFTRIASHSQLSVSRMFSVLKTLRRQFCGEQNHIIRHDHGTPAVTARRTRYSARAALS